jgi:hypothetical protein
VPNEIEYTDEEWAEIAGHRPLAGVHVNQVVVLHRHWIWANHQRQRFRTLLPETAGPHEDEAFMVSECFGSMYLWYALLWAVIEGFDDRGIEVRGRMASDIQSVSDVLRRCRNAVFHVPSKNQHHDPRLFQLMENPDSAAILSRISTGFGRLFIEEGQARHSEQHAQD